MLEKIALALHQKINVEFFSLLRSLQAKEGHFDPMCGTNMFLFSLKLIIILCNDSKPPICPICDFEFLFFGQNRTKNLQNGQGRHPIGGSFKIVK